MADDYSSDTSKLARELTLQQILALLGISLADPLATEATLLDVLNALGPLLTTAAFQARINTLGQKTSAASTPVVLPSDQVVPVSQPIATASVVTPVAQSAVAVPLLAANAAARYRWVHNNSAGAAVLFVKWGAGASLVSFTQPLQKGESMFWAGYEYSGAVEGIWSLAGAGSALVTETT